MKIAVVSFQGFLKVTVFRFLSILNLAGLRTSKLADKLSDAWEPTCSPVPHRAVDLKSKTKDFSSVFSLRKNVD